MQPWQTQVIQLQRLPAQVGTTLNFLCQQDSVISELLIDVEGVIGTAAATANPEGLAAILQNVRVTGSLNQGGNINPINNIRGPSLTEMAQFIRANVSYSFGALGSTGAFGVMVPCTFLHWRFPDPYRTMSCLPANAMGSLNLSVTIANTNQIDVNATPALVFTSIAVQVQQNQYFANSIPKSYAFLVSTIDMQVQANPQGGTGQQQQFPNGAAYLNILIRSMLSTSATVRACTAKQADGSTGPIDVSTTTFGLSLLDTNNVPKRQMNWYELRKDNFDHITDALVPGNACFQFNRGIADIWRPTPGPNIIPLNIGYDLTGTTRPQIEFVYQRLFDPTNALALL